MNLTIATIATSLIIRWSTPLPGTYHLYTLTDPSHAKIVASYPVHYGQCSAAYTVEPDQSHLMFFVQYVP